MNKLIVKFFLIIIIDFVKDFYLKEYQNSF